MVDERELFERVTGKRSALISKLPMPPIEDPFAALLILIEELKLGLKPPAVPVKKAPRVRLFDEPHQVTTVAAGDFERIFYYRIPRPDKHRGYLRFVGNNWFTDTKIYWRVDDVLVVDPYLDYEIAKVNAPQELIPYIRVDKEIVWEAKNESNLSCTFEVLQNGFYVPKEDIPLLLDLGVPISGEW